MRYYDPPNRRLIYVGSRTTENYWDTHWQPDQLTRNKILANKRTYTVPLTQRHLKPANGPILEGGCGWGQHVAALVHNNYTCIGVDYAPKTVESLNQLVPELDVRLGDVHDLPFADEFFAGYWSLGVIEHFWHGYKRIALEMKRVLKPGGILFLTFPYLSPLRCWKIRRNLYEIWTGGEIEPPNFYQFALDHPQVVEFYDALGFSLVETVPLDGLKGLKDEIDFGKRWLQAWYDYRGRSFVLRGSRLLFSRLAALWSAQFHFEGVAKRVINVMANRHLGYSVRRRYIDEFYHHHVSALPVGCTLLDVGGNRINKRGQFNLGQYPLQVIYVNLSRQKKPDVQADAAFLPLPESSFECVICAELLEHVPDPECILQELYRVLVPGGKLLMTVPFLYPIHADPYDYGRYTDFFWEHALRVAGFDTFVIERQGTFYTVLLLYIKLFVNRFWRRPFRWFAAPFMAGTESFLRWHEQRNQIKTDPFLTSFTTGFGIVAVKPRKITS